MRTSFHHQPEAQHPNFQLSTSWQADYPIFAPKATVGLKKEPRSGPPVGGVSSTFRWAPWSNCCLAADYRT
jgi:hypothetical protein